MSANKITLPSGATVTLRDTKTLRVKDRKKVMQTAELTEGGDVTRAMALGDALVALMIEDWSLDLIIPSVKIDSIGELEPLDYDFLIEQTKDVQKALFPNLAETPETEADPKATTANSNG